MGNASAKIRLRGVSSFVVLLAVLASVSPVGHVLAAAGMHPQRESVAPTPSEGRRSGHQPPTAIQWSSDFAPTTAPSSPAPPAPESSDPAPLDPLPALPPTPPQPDSGPDCSVEACVAITFDDGPGPYTDDLLDTLEAREVNATFLVVGAGVEALPDTARRIVDDGHQIGNHTWNHPDLAKASAGRIQSELRRTADVIQDVTGVAPTIMRPPYGAYDRQVVDVAGSAGFGAVILWDVDTRDWKTRDAAATIRAVETETQRGSIILMHDIHQPTVDAVPGVINALKAKGYHLVTVDQLLATESTPSGSVHTHGPR